MLLRHVILLLLLFCPSIVLGASQDSYLVPSPIRGLSAERSLPDSQLPHIKPSMLTAGFWIARHPSVDKIIMTPRQIDAFNANIRDHLKLTKDIFSLVDHFQTESLMDVFKRDIGSFTNKGYYTIKGIQDDNDFLDKVRNTMYLSGVVLGIEPRYGLVIHLAAQRVLPTVEGLYAHKGDIDFDELQNSALDVASPVAIVHQSQDGKWYYVFSALSDGWVQADNVAIGDMNSVKNFMQTKDFVVITSSKADLFLDQQMTQFDDYARMGVKFPLLEENDNQWVVQIPVKGKDNQLQLVKGYIPKTQAHQGYLPYSARTIYEQAFLMLDKPYGWGDMYGQQDCSRFLQMVYATVGIELPRDSRNQAQVGQELASFDEKATNKERLDSLRNALGALTILPMKGHIMLYLGMADGVPFAIHDTSGYSKLRHGIQIKYVLNRVVVSDLSLGEDSAKGSLLRRLSKIVGIQ